MSSSNWIVSIICFAIVNAERYLLQGAGGSRGGGSSSGYSGDSSSTSTGIGGGGIFRILVSNQISVHSHHCIYILS